MEDKSKYFVVKQKGGTGGPFKVVEAKKLLETVRAITVRKQQTGWGSVRSSFLQI